MASGAEINLICIDLKPHEGRLKVCVQEFGFRGYGCFFPTFFFNRQLGGVSSVVVSLK